jgi:hypothetical protein
LSVTPKVSDGTQPISIQFFVQNTGPVAGAEVPQLYLGLPPQTGEPPKRLVAFNKVRLNPGEGTMVQFTVNPAATNHPLSYWDSNSNNWGNARVSPDLCRQLIRRHQAHGHDPCSPCAVRRWVGDRAIWPAGD